MAEAAGAERVGEVEVAFGKLEDGDVGFGAFVERAQAVAESEDVGLVAERSMTCSRVRPRWRNLDRVVARSKTGPFTLNWCTSLEMVPGRSSCLRTFSADLSGFSDMLAGVALARDPELIARLRGVRALLGNILQPDECWMLDGRLPTVALRMNRQSKNAQRIAERLAGHPRVERVLYPSLFTDPQQIAIRDRQCRFPGAILSLELKGGKEAAFDFLRRLHIARNAVSLGGVESLACHPRTTTHSEMSEQELEAAGVGESLVRISVGTEDWRDLLADFEEALG